MHLRAGRAVGHDAEEARKERGRNVDGLIHDAVVVGVGIVDDAGVMAIDAEEADQRVGMGGNAALERRVAALVLDGAPVDDAGAALEERPHAVEVLRLRAEDCRHAVVVLDLLAGCVLLLNGRGRAAVGALQGPLHGGVGGGVDADVETLFDD